MNLFVHYVESIFINYNSNKIAYKQDSVIKTDRLSIESKDVNKRSQPYIVENIIGKKYLDNNKEVQYRIYWKGYTINSSTWEDEIDVMENCKELIDKFNKGCIKEIERYEDVKYVQASYNYKERDDTELSFKKGDKIKIIDTDMSKGWLNGEINGKKGLFPYNYVKQLPPQKCV